MRLPLCLLLVCASSWAQTGATPSPMAQLMEKHIASNEEATLVVLDTPKGAWKAAVDALGADPEWIELEVDTEYFAAKAREVEPVLRRRTSLGPLPQWVLIQAGRVVGSGGTAPNAATLLTLAQEGGLRSYTQRLRDFCQRQPDHLQARFAYLMRASQLAARRTAITLGLKIEAWPASDQHLDWAAWVREREAKAEARAQADAEAKPPARLGSEDDARIWTEVSENLRALIQSGDWLEVLLSGTLELPDEALHSELMAGTTRACLPLVESALGRSPTNMSLWRTWLSLARTMGGRPIRPLLDSLRAFPGQDIHRMLPDFIKSTYVRDARQRRDWTGIRDLLLPELEDAALYSSLHGDTTTQLVRNGKAEPWPETGDYWRDTLEPLVEALLMLGETREADAWVTRRWARHPWAALPARAAALATRCGQPGLAAKWAALAGN